MNRSKQAERVVARNGITALLIVFASAIMSFLMLYTLQLGSLANNISRQWENALTGSATVRIVATEQGLSDAAPAVEEVLATTPGIASYAEINTSEQLELLAPWLGDELPRDVLSLPRLYSVDIDLDNFDEQALILRLKSEAPAAVWDNHNRWQGPLLESAQQLKKISWFSSFLIALTFLGLIFITSEATIASNAQSIALLRQIGARDRWIQSGFVRKFAIRAGIGAVIGAVVGIFVTNRLLDNSAAQGTLLENHASTSSIFAAIALIAGAIITTTAATLWATGRYLKRNE